MSDTVEEVDPGTLRVPNSTGDNTTETYGVWYPFDGALAPEDSLEDARNSLRWARLQPNPECDGAMVVKITIERIDV